MGVYIENTRNQLANIIEKVSLIAKKETKILKIVHNINRKIKNNRSVGNSWGILQKDYVKKT